MSSKYLEVKRNKNYCYSCGTKGFITKDNPELKYLEYTLFIIENKVESYCMNCVYDLSRCKHQLFKCLCEENKWCRNIKSTFHYDDNEYCRKKTIGDEFYCEDHINVCFYLEPSLRFKELESCDMLFNYSSCKKNVKIGHHGKAGEYFQVFRECSTFPEEINLIIYDYYLMFGNGGCDDHCFKS